MNTPNLQQLWPKAFAAGLISVKTGKRRNVVNLPETPGLSSKERQSLYYKAYYALPENRERYLRQKTLMRERYAQKKQALAAAAAKSHPGPPPSKLKRQLLSEAEKKRRKSARHSLYMRRIKSDPIRRAAFLKRQREYTAHRIATDPQFKASQRQRQKECMRRKRARDRAQTNDVTPSLNPE